MQAAKLFTRENRARMGAAIWVFGMLTEQMDRAGRVDDGRPLDCGAIGAALGLSASEVRRHLARLDLCGALSVERTRLGPVVKVLRAGPSDAGGVDRPELIDKASSEPPAKSAMRVVAGERERFAVVSLAAPATERPLAPSMSKPPGRETECAAVACGEPPGPPIAHEELFLRALQAVAPGHDAALPGLVRSRAREVDPTVSGLEVAVLLEMARPDGYTIRGNGYFAIAVPKLMRSQVGAFLSEIRAYGYRRSDVAGFAEGARDVRVRRAARILRRLLPGYGPPLEVAT